MQALTQSMTRKSLIAAPTLADRIIAASDVLSPVWPLETFIACNPLNGMQALPFEEAAMRAARYHRMGKQNLPQREAVNLETIKWCSLFLDDGQASIPMPNRSAGFYACFRDLARFDPVLRAHAGYIAALPAAAEEAIEASFERLGISADDQEEFIRQSLAALPGWAGHVLWRTSWQHAGEGLKNPITLTEYVAVRLVLTSLLWPKATLFAPEAVATPRYLDNTLPEAEDRYRTALLSQLQPQRTVTQSAQSRADAQLVFCIDVRSEPFRRHLEALGNYQTLGFAGFFGLPVRVKPEAAQQAHDSCPVLLKSHHEVCEHVAPCAPTRERYLQGRALLKLPAMFYQALKYNLATPYALVEMLGPWLGLRMAARTLLPSATAMLRTHMAGRVAPSVQTELALEGMDIATQAGYGESALRLMGLTENFAPFVVLCGHGSTTSNNAYASALDCGACGGNHGGINARILAQILNTTQVREVLHTHGLVIPADTHFLAAEHDTTTDEVTLFADQTLSDAARWRLLTLRGDLKEAQERNSQSRFHSFGKDAVGVGEREAFTRSNDWAEVRPEWGLARNAAFIVGPRSLTRALDLEGRCFLHSYDWELDAEGLHLATILTAPMVVAQWINSQYLFSTLDNVAYGSGSKVTQNITGKLGVMQGNASDLMHGLPLQSVYEADDAPYHEAQRLLTVVQAPRGRLQGIIEMHQILQTLFYNGWVQLVVLDPEDGYTYLLKRDKTWQLVE